MWAPHLPIIIAPNILSPNAAPIPVVLSTAETPSTVEAIMPFPVSHHTPRAWVISNFTPSNEDPTRISRKDTRMCQSSPLTQGGIGTPLQLQAREADNFN